MHKRSLILIILVGALATALIGPDAQAQQLNDIASEHLLMRIPKERDLLGRRIIADLERFYLFLGGAIDVKLPRRIILLVDWDVSKSSASYRDSSIIVGMNHPAVSDPGVYLLNESAREIARLGLLILSRGADRPDYEFLYEGMIEILVHEFSHTSRSLESTWVIAQFLDEMKHLGLENQRAWSEFSGDRPCIRSAAPGVTFFLTFRDLKGRKHPVKFFEALKRANLSKSLEDTFGESASELEKVWLEKVRGYKAPEEITITASEVPQLIETDFNSDGVKPGDSLNIRLLFKDSAGVLLPDGVFIRDERTGKLYTAQEDSDKNSGYILGTIPVEKDCAPGRYNLRITVVDESGNLRRWKETYEVVGSQQ
jgi:hypothetical protein